MTTLLILWVAGLLLLVGVVTFMAWYFDQILLDIWHDAELAGLIISTFGIILLGVLVYSAVKDWKFLDVLYFTIITLMTVEYGDFAPQTMAGKVFPIVYIIMGLGLVSSFILVVAERNARIIREKREQHKE